MITLTGNRTFCPNSVTISAGTTIRWVNGSTTFHTVTPQGHTEFNRWTTDTSGQSMEHTFSNTGTFNYFCEPHQALGMTGVIIVQ